MQITEENLIELAVSYYHNIGCTGETEFERDLDIAKKVSQQLNKIAREDPKANPRLLMNYVVTLFNVFEFIFARELLIFCVDEKLHPRLKALLMVTNRADWHWHREITPCLNTIELLTKELPS